MNRRIRIGSIIPQKGPCDKVEVKFATLMAPLQYLTVQDILWINLHVTGSPQEFRYADLEEAVYYQYGYGASTNLITQAATFLSGFLEKKPLATGNEATAFIGCLAFLKVNGIELKLDNPESWFRAVQNGTHEAEDAISKAAHKAQDGHHLEIEDAIEAVKAEYAGVIANLARVAV